MLFKQVFDFADFLRIMITNFLVPNKLQFCILKVKLIHHGQSMIKIAADTIANYT